MAYTKEVIFCAKYLQRLGLLNDYHIKILSQLAKKSSVEFSMTEVKEGFFVELATALRPLWPPGDKDGKYAWRDSVENLASRLKTLWDVRGLGSYSIDTCVEIANKYLSRFQNDARYMQILKYFILKQKRVSIGENKYRYVNQSVFADMLESATDDELQQNEWNKLLEGASMSMEGHLV